MTGYDDLVRVLSERGKSGAVATAGPSPRSESTPMVGQA